MTDNSEKMSYKAGVAKGQTQEKANTMLGNAANAAQSAKDSVVQAGSLVQAKAQGATEAVMNATGMNKKT